MANINRDYLIVLDAKSSVISEADELKYYITDEHSQNLFVNLVVRDIERINKYVEVHDPEKYELELHIVKPNNDIVRPHLQANLLSAQDAIYAFELPKETTDYIGTYKCELRVTYKETDETTITTSNKFKYKVKRSIYNDLDSIQEAPQYPIVIQLFDKLSDINQYEEDRRANELARQLAEQQRQTRFDALDANMVDGIQEMDDKVVEVENRITTKEQAVDKLITDTKADIDEYKAAKDQEIDEYKTAKDTEINNAITNQDSKINTAISSQNDRITLVENNDVAQDNRLDVLENKDVLHESRLDAVEVKNQQQDNRLDIVENKNTQQDNRLDVIEAKNVEQDNRLDTIEAIDVSQNTRLDAIEVKNQQQDDRLLDIEKVNKRQDMNLKCLFAESKNNMIDITEEGNSIYLQNSTTGYTLIDEIKGNTLVNCNKEPNKELILNGNINTSGDNAVTITEGVDGGLVDVALEGNTLVNVSKTKDTTAITKAYTVENSDNHIALQGDIDGSCRPVITGNTLWIDNNTEEVLTAFDENRNLRLQSSFEDNLVTQEMVDSGEEEIGNLGKYRVEYRTAGKNKFNLSKLVVGSFNSSTGADKDNDNACRTGFIKLEPATYKLTKNTKQWQTVIGYDNKFNYLCIIYDGNVTSGTFTIPETVTYVRFKFDYDIDTALSDNIQLEYGDTATPYEPYKEYTKTLYLNSPLLEGDTIEEKDNGIYHVHRSELVAYTEGDETSLITDKVNTLHELVTPQYELIEQSNLAIPSYTNGHLDFDTAVPVEKVEFKPFTEELTYLYANTQYTVQFISYATITADITLGGTKLLAQNIVKGLNRINITTPSELVDNKLVIDGVGANISEVVVTDTDREFEYFEGMKSVGQDDENGHKIEILSSVGKPNLIKNSGFLNSTSNYIFHNGSKGEVIDDASSQSGKILKITTGTNGGVSGPFQENIVKHIEDKKYTLSGWCKGEVGTTLGVYIERHKSVSITFTNDDWVRFVVTSEQNPTNWNRNITFYSSNTSKIFYLKDIKMEESENDTPYVPHTTEKNYNSFNKINKKEILINEPLRSVPNGTKDRFVKIGGKWFIERNIRQKLLTGVDSEEWVIHNNSDENVIEFKYNVGSPIVTDNSGLTLSDKFIGKSTGYVDRIAWGSETIYITISKNKLATVDVVGFKQWLSNNNVLVQNQLVTPTYEPIDYNPLEVYSGTTRIATNSTIPTNITVRNHGYNCLLRPNTTYTISSNLGLNTVTTPSVLTEDCLRFMDTDTSDITTMKDVLVLEGDWTTKADLIPSNFSGIESAFEQEYDEEKGKYKVNVKVANEDKSKENNITFYLNEPLRGVGDVKDKVFVKDDKVVVERKCGIRPYEDGDFGTYLTDKVDTVYPLAEPTYEEVEYNDVKLFIESFKNSTLFYNSNVSVSSTVHYSYSVPIIDTVSQTASISDEQDVMIIDLATQVAVMEMMLM